MLQRMWAELTLDPDDVGEVAAAFKKRGFVVEVLDDMDATGRVRIEATTITDFDDTDRFFDWVDSIIQPINHAAGGWKECEISSHGSEESCSVGHGSSTH